MTDTLSISDVTTATELPTPGEWSIHWRGKTYGEAGITGQHLAVLALIAGTDDFESLDIDPRHGHQRLMMMIAAVATVEAVTSLGADVEEGAVEAQVAQAVADVSAAPVEEILGALRFG
jgi:hypothetical protein